MVELLLGLMVGWALAATLMVLHYRAMFLRALAAGEALDRGLAKARAELVHFTTTARENHLVLQPMDEPFETYVLTDELEANIEADRRGE